MHFSQEFVKKKKKLIKKRKEINAPHTFWHLEGLVLKEQCLITTIILHQGQ